MKKLLFLSAGVLAVISLRTYAQRDPSAQVRTQVIVKATKVLDVRSGKYLEEAAVLIEGDRIKEVGTAAVVQGHAHPGAKVIDLGRATLLPGLIDCHTHLMARFESGKNGYLLGLATKSQAYRALEGAADARETLHAGFTAVRDVENEGSGYADVALRDAINNGLVEGPRMQVATRAIAAVGQYNPFGVSPDLTDFPTGADMVSGAEDARRAVREQIGHGADLIKVYADWDHLTLTLEEMHVIVEEAHKAHLKVAAHATTTEGIKNAINAGVDSIEHGFQIDKEEIEMMKEKGVFLVPTVGVVDDQVAKAKAGPVTPEQAKKIDGFVQGTYDEIRMALKAGVKIADGFDPSEEGRHGKNAEELAAMVRRGMSPIEAIRAATLNAAELMGWTNSLGAIEAGKYADLIAVDDDPLTDITVLAHVKWVMKGGDVVKDEQSK